MFSKVGRKTASNAVMEQILEQIHDGQLTAGARLPSETKLMAAFGVGRSTVREAFKALEVMGIIRRTTEGAFIHDGNFGGLISTQLYTETVIQRIEIRHLYATRRLLEMELNGLAAEHASDADIAQLEALCDMMEATEIDKVETYLRIDRQFHATISKMSGNPFLARMWGLTYDVFLVMRQRLGLNQEFLDASNKLHRQLTRSIASRDRKLAQAAVENSLRVGEENMAAAADMSALYPDA